MWRKLFAVLGIVVLCAIPVQAQIVQFSGASVVTFTPAWQTLALGDGGQGSGFAAASDGTLVSWNNTYGAHLHRKTGTCSGWGTTYSAPCWEQLFTATSVSPTLSFPNGINGGGIAVSVCNSNTNVAYALWNGYLWVTQNLQSSSRTWKQTTLTTTQNPNDNNLIGNGNYLACDPNNPAIAYIATPSALEVTTNGTGATPTFSSVSGVGTVGSVPDAIYFDPASTTTGTCPSSCYTNHFYVFTYSTGVYETYNGGSPQSGSFTKTSSGPTTFYGMAVSPFSELYAVTGGADVYKYSPNGTAGSGTWSTSVPDVTNSNAYIVAVDPTSSSKAATRIAAAYYDGNISVSTNDGSTWSGSGTITISATSPQPTWMQTANQSSGGALYLSMVSLLFDYSGNLWGAGGIANYYIAPTVAESPEWIVDTLGVEQLVGEGVISALGNAPVTWQWDRAFMTVQDLDVFPSTYWPGSITSNIYGSVGPIEGGWDLDYASSDTNFLTGWAGEQGTVPASSSDGGNTWTVWPTTPASINVGGAVAASTTANWILVAGLNEALYYTTNAGTTWTEATVSGTPTDWITTQGVRLPLAADRVNANTFCAIDGDQNIYSSTNSGATWTKEISSGTVDGSVNVDMLIAVPGEPDFFYTGSSSSGNSAGSNHLWKISKTTNECDTATDLDSNLTGVYAFGFGAPKPGNSYPTIYAYGEYSSVLGLYENDDAGASGHWALINVPSSQQVWPKNSQDFVTYVSGDMNVYGMIYVMFRGSGGAYIQTQDACPYVNFTSSFKPTVSLTGTVTLQAQQSGLLAASSVSFYVDSTLIGTQTSGSGTPTTYSQSWVTGNVAHGSHTLEVTATGNGCSGSFSIPITTSMLDPANDNSLSLARTA